MDVELLTSLQIFNCPRMKFSEIPQRLNQLLMPPDPIIINHVISVEGSDQKKTACYDIDVEVDDTLKQQMNNFLLSTTSQQEIAALDNKVRKNLDVLSLGDSAIGPDIIKMCRKEYIVF